MNLERKSGILLHPTSLPGPYGIGDLGPEAYRWIDFLADSGTQLWQILPLGPTGYGDSPYQCFSAFAGNPYLISPLMLVDDGLLSVSDLRDRPDFPVETVDYGSVISWKTALLHRAFASFEKNSSGDLHQEFQVFSEENRSWLDDYALFMAIKESQDLRSWTEWPLDLKMKEETAILNAKENLCSSIKKQRFNQFLFFRQWEGLKAYAHSKNVRIIGDMPFVISMDSADVWANPELFLLDENLNPTFVAGVPPDYFSATGQLWGNPLYRWENHQKTNFSWWVSRLRSILNLVDMVRLDHFRGFAAAWHVPYGNETAIEGEWIPGPAVELFTELKNNFPDLPIIAEDLGVITQDVESLRDGFGLPGMKILQFGFSGDPEDDFLPHHYAVHSVAYTGTHDNNTAKGWFDLASDFERAFCSDYLGFEGSEQVSWAMIRAVWQSAAVFALAPMQDLLALGIESRFNLPGKMDGNWQWRMKGADLTPQLAKRLKRFNLLYSRLSSQEKEKYTQWLNTCLGDAVKPH